MMKRVLSLVLLCMISMLVGCQKDGEKVVLQIDDISVSEAEFEMAMSENRTDVILYFGETYGESQFEETFWTKVYGKNNEKPIDVLKQKAVDEITSNLAVLLSAKEAGIISSVSYEDILEMYIQENEARKESVDKGEVIYGVTTFEFRDYYDWLISNCKMQLRNQLSEKVTEQEIRDYYEKEKENIAKIPSVLTCKQYFIPIDEDKEKALENAKTLLNEINTGKTFEIAGQDMGMVSTEEEYDLSTGRGMSVMYPQLYEVLSTITLDEVKLVEEAAGYYIIRLESVEGQQFETVEKVATKIVSLLAQEKLEDQLAQKSSKMKLIKKKAFDKIQIGDIEN